MPQSLSNVVLHLVFSTKNRYPWITKDIRPDLNRYMTGTLANMGCPVIQIGGVEDHMHVLCALGRTITIAKTVEQAKTGTNSWLKDERGLKDFSWQGGYGSFSVGRREVETLIRYIQNQEEHHKNVSFQDEYRALLHEAGIPFDEKYVWD